MSVLRRRFAARFSLALRLTLAATFLFPGSAAPWALCFAQETGTDVTFRVSQSSQRLEMIVSTSRILEMEFKVPKMLVNNPDLVRAQPLAPNKIQISALKPGVTQLNLWDENDQVHSVDVVVLADARELTELLKSEFPDASLRVRPLASSVIISGYAPAASMVSRIVALAEDYYPKVINNIEVGGAQTVLLHCKIVEVSRTKLRAVGFDFAQFNGNDAVVSSVSGLISDYTLGGMSSVSSTLGETVAFGIIDGSQAFFGFLEALRQNNLAKVLSEPTLVTVSGRPASFNSGGEFPIIVPQSLGTISVEYREFGTRVDFVPIVLGNGTIRLEVRPQVSEIDASRSVTINNTSVPGLRNRWVDTAVEMQAGQTLALAGLIQNRVEAENRGIPYLADLPWIGAAFRRVEESTNEIELLVLVTPEFVDAMDPHEVPPCGPGQFTGSPSDLELYGRGYTEVPRCCPHGRVFEGPGGGCPHCQGELPGGYPADGYPADGAVFESFSTDSPGSVIYSDESRDSRGAGSQREANADASSAGSSPRDPGGRTTRPAGAGGQGSDGGPQLGQPERQEPTRQDSANPQTPGSSRSKTSRLRQPSLIGPVGYDVLK